MLGGLALLKRLDEPAIRNFLPVSIVVAMAASGLIHRLIGVFESKRPTDMEEVSGDTCENNRRTPGVGKRSLLNDSL